MYLLIRHGIDFGKITIKNGDILWLKEKLQYILWSFEIEGFLLFHKNPLQKILELYDRYLNFVIKPIISLIRKIIFID